MANQYIWMGITIGIFVAGLGIGYAINQYTVTPNMMAQNMQHMMQDQTQRRQLISQLTQNPQLMSDWMITMMSNPQTMQQMHDLMMNDPEHMQTMMQIMGPNMMGMMMNNPQMQQQMMNTMMQNHQFMQSMMTNSQFQQNWIGPWVSNNTNWNGMMGSGMVNHNMMMGNPITKSNDVLNTVKNIENLLIQISSKYKSGDKDAAFSLASIAYLENYEYIEGTVATKDRQLMEKIELMLRVDLRNLIKSGSTQADVDSKIDSIKSELEKVKSLFK